LDELITYLDDETWGQEGGEWREQARWIKFEENVIGSANKWGSPHVAPLSFKSLIELHRFLEQGTLSGTTKNLEPSL